jgi:hypothetical protein
VERRDGDARRAKVVAEQYRHVVPDDGDGRDLGLGQGEGAAVVLEQDDAVLRRLQGQALVLLLAHLVGAMVAVPVVLGVAIEDAQPLPDGYRLFAGIFLSGKQLREPSPWHSGAEQGTTE